MRVSATKITRSNPQPVEKKKLPRRPPVLGERVAAEQWQRPPFWASAQAKLAYEKKQNEAKENNALRLMERVAAL